MLVEAIEDNFVPVLVYNNKEEDAKTLKSFNEPSWNNPVTRFLSSSGRDAIPRKDGIWSVNAMAKRMAAALKSTNNKVPGYLTQIADQPAQQELATFAMHCYWVGEGKLGSIPGVLNTHSAWRDGLEVVEVTYDPDKVTYSKLLEVAQSFDCASKVFAHSNSQLAIARKAVGNKATMATGKSRAAKLSDQKYYLRNTPGLKSLPLTKFQSTKLNAALLNKTSLTDWLSPRQIELYQRIRSHLKPQSAKSMTQFIFPEDDSKLPAYTTRLNAHLDLTKQPKKPLGSGRK